MKYIKRGWVAVVIFIAGMAFLTVALFGLVGDILIESTHDHESWNPFKWDW